ncbi:DUF4173 domain-containing protein [Chryseobacterium nematophagum]|uniref:DUF4173 domain-containing protein n=1 Tax=Chryseobacterium nematophagum TaxID=2305228 RepID=A0A3M7LFZ0_9FLAO|nr:DUF4173 domain-containing protein [Chryseobacterium nematophagum]RMZ60486.1 DUF4173 domain-containing protein [Chryseobacterium nematophagum]
MKTHQYIFLTTFLFVILFYNQNLGLNLGILGMIYSLLTFIKTPEKNRSKTFWVFFITSILSSVAFAWYGDFSSFLALISSLLLLSYRAKNRRMKILFLIPVFIINCVTSVCRFFDFDDWLPNRNISGLWQKTLAFVLIPFLLLAVFFGVYSLGSDHFANLFMNIQLDVDFLQIVCLSALGFFIAFNYWNYAIERLIYKNNNLLDNQFQEKDKIQKQTYAFLDLGSERMSGVISFLCLNILLIFFIISYNYEQWYETVKTPTQLSEETHERVNAVIISIIMAILVIMFYFKSSFNFDPKARLMKWLAKIWIVLNAILVLSAMIKNTEYIVSYGFTYKRLGVYAFLLLSLVGLVLTYIKVHMKKRNAYLVNTMVGYFYAIILICSYINWGGIITSQNVNRNNFNIDLHMTEVNFNEKTLLEYAAHIQDKKLEKEIVDKIKMQQTKSMLSKILYYEEIK